MKKIIATALAVVLILGCAGCGGYDLKLKDQLFGDVTTGPSQSVPEATQPDATVPDVPEQSEPDQSSDPTTQPTEPEPTEPQVQPGTIQGIYTTAELEAMDKTVNGWGLGPYTDDENRPVDATKAQEKYGDREAYFIVPADGKIYLTFDEGYENGYTSQILDVLKEKDVKAVFFVTMQYVKDEPELIQRMIDEGHVVGNHSVRHKSMPTLDLDTMMAEVVDLHEYVEENFGYEMYLFRPPMGHYSEQSLSVLQELGYKSVLWSFAYYDYAVDDQPDPQKAYDKIVAAAHSGAIYLLHAVSKTNTEVLGDVIDAFRDQGFEMALME